MSKCLKCGHEAYIGLNKIECSNVACEHFHLEVKTETLTSSGQKLKVVWTLPEPDPRDRQSRVLDLIKMITEVQPMTSDKTSLGDRMKSYEDVSESVLLPRTPYIIRVDGKAFHTYTKGCERPWDSQLEKVMDLTAKALCENIQGAQIAYVQSDEISVLVHDYKTFYSQRFFGGRIQKIASVCASIAGATFTRHSWQIFDDYNEADKSKLINPAYFDCRVFSLPEDDVCNYFLWRQQDCTRNSIQMLARSLYSSKELHKKKTKELMDLCHAKGKNWNDVPTRNKRGRCITNESYYMPVTLSLRHNWIIDDEIPIFSEDRNYINQYLTQPDDK